MKTGSLARKQTDPVGYGQTSDLGRDAVAAISANLRQLLADVFALYLKTKNFHWHMTGRHFRDYQLLLDEQGEQIFSMTDDIAERARKLGRSTLRSISQQRSGGRARRYDPRAGRRQSAADRIHASVARALRST
jgi:DNA-binding ferritin-like protein